jgi:hypothetical protein
MACSYRTWTWPDSWVASSRSTQAPLAERVTFQALGALQRESAELPRCGVGPKRNRHLRHSLPAPLFCPVFNRAFTRFF